MIEIESFEHCGLKIQIAIDEDQEFHNSREWCNLGTMVCWHRRYVLGDEQPDESPNEWYDRHKDDPVILPLYLIDHSGISMNTSGFSYCDPGEWDSGQVGWIYVDEETLIKEYGEGSYEVENWHSAIERANKCLISEVEVYDAYLRGEIYSFTVEDSDGDILDSCGGYVGDLDYVISEAKSSAEWHAKEIKREHKAVRYWNERDIVTV